MTVSIPSLSWWFPFYPGLRSTLLVSFPDNYGISMVLFVQIRNECKPLLFLFSFSSSRLPFRLSLIVILDFPFLFLFLWSFGPCACCQLLKVVIFPRLTLLRISAIASLPINLHSSRMSFFFYIFLSMPQLFSQNERLFFPTVS